MNRNVFRAMVLYVALCFVILLASITVLSVDLGNYINKGQFLVCQEFNIVKYKSIKGSLENLEQAVRAYEKISIKALKADFSHR